MTMDQRNHGLGSMGFDHMPYGNGPQFTNPWGASSSPTPHPHIFPNSVASNNAGFDAIAKQQAQRATTVSMPYSSVPASAPSMGASNGFPSTTYGQSELLGMSQDLLNSHPRSTYEQGYSAAPTSVNTYAPTSTPYVSAYGSVTQPQQDEVRRLSQS